jgi:hypothetical protein
MAQSDDASLLVVFDIIKQPPPHDDACLRTRTTAFGFFFLFQQLMLYVRACLNCNDEKSKDGSGLGKLRANAGETE